MNWYKLIHLGYIKVKDIFLSSTDYQTIRESEGGAPISDETCKERADARARVNELEELIAKTKEIEPEKIGHKKIWPKKIGSEEIEPEVPERHDDINDDIMQVEE